MTFAQGGFAAKATPDTDNQVEDAVILRELSDTVWDMLLDRFLGIPDLANLSLTHIRLLYWLRDRVPVTLTAARDGFGPSPTVTERLLVKLFRRGLVSRCGDLHDRNRIYLRLSDRGLLLLARIESCQQRSFRRLLSSLTMEELHDFTASFDLILQYEHRHDTPAPDEITPDEITKRSEHRNNAPAEGETIGQETESE